MLCCLGGLGLLHFPVSEVGFWGWILVSFDLCEFCFLGLVSVLWFLGFRSVVSFALCTCRFEF